MSNMKKALDILKKGQRIVENLKTNIENIWDMNETLGKNKENVVEFPDMGQIMNQAGGDMLDVPDYLNNPAAIAARMNLIEGMKAAEEAVRKTLCGLNAIAGIHIGVSSKKRIRYVGELTLVGKDGDLYGQTIEGPVIEKAENWTKDSLDTRRELAEMLRNMANALYENIKEQP